MVSSDPAKSGVWIDVYDYHSKEKSSLPLQKDKSPPFCSVSQQKQRDSHPVIAESWKSS